MEIIGIILSYCLVFIFVISFLFITRDYLYQKKILFWNFYMFLFSFLSFVIYYVWIMNASSIEHIIIGSLLKTILVFIYFYTVINLLNYLKNNSTKKEA